MEDSTRVVSIDFARIRKGDVISNEQVEHHFIERIMGREKYEQQLAEYERGERIHHPIGRAHAAVSEEIMRECAEIGYRVVCRTKQKTVEVLTDSDAMVYRNNRANSSLGLHRRQVRSLHADIDESQLTADERRQLEQSRNYHTMVELSIASGKRTLKEMQRGRLVLGGKG
jgi:hypothetical protein